MIVTLIEAPTEEELKNPNNNAKHFTYEWVTHYFLTFLNKLCCIIYNRNYVITLEEIYAKN